MSRVERHLARLFLVVACALILFVGLEGAARVYLVRVASDSAFAKYASLEQAGRRADGFRFTPHRYLGFIPTPSWRNGNDRHNALGYRGEESEQPKPAGQFRVACLGGSTTYTTGVSDWRLAYPAQLERILREVEGYEQVRVINAGASSWSSWESLINLELRVLDLDPDLIVIYHGINDIHPRLVWPPEVYRGDNSGRRVATEASPLVHSVLHHSTLARIALIRLGLARPQAELEIAMGGAAATYWADEFEDQVRNGRYPSGIFVEATASEMLRANPPRYFKRNLENMVAVARQQGVGVVLATFAYSPAFPDEPRVASTEYKNAYAETNAVTREVAATTGADLFDFAAVFPQDPRYYTDGRHVNAEGAALKARMFAEYFIGRGLLPRATPSP